MILSVAGAAVTANAVTGQTTRVSVNGAGAPANLAAGQGAISANGRYVVFSSAATNLGGTPPAGTTNVYRHDRVTHMTAPVSLNNSGNFGLGSAISPSVSADGRYVAFAYTAGDLVTGDTNDQMDVFLRDTVLGTTRLVSTSTLGAQGDQLSGLGGLWGARTVSDDGRYVVFNSLATTLVPDTNNGKLQVYR
jgi:Tol biopolymer transport system component